ncbi:MAG: hypothetical protein RLZZ427_1519 [Pseudomonadota bacterium]|jgi:hypothetical protein
MNDFAPIAARLIEQARQLAHAHARAHTAALRTVPVGRAARWRWASLLWPLFTKG